jgi:hypothetical protein
LDGSFIGMNFYDGSVTTPFLPRKEILTVLRKGFDLLERYFFLQLIADIHVWFRCSAPTYIKNMLHSSTSVGRPINMGDNLGPLSSKTLKRKRNQ